MPRTLYLNFYNNIKDLEKNCFGFEYYTLLGGEGYCYGLAHMWGKAFLTGTRTRYLSRLKILTRDYKINPIEVKGKKYYCLSEFMNGVIIPFERNASEFKGTGQCNYYLGAPECIGLSFREYDLYISIRAFLDELLLCHMPFKIEDKGYLLKKYHQNSYPLKYRQSALHASEYIGYNNGIKEVFNRPFVFTKDNVKTIFEKLFDEIDKKFKNIRCYIAFNSIEHTICVGYQNGKYCTYNANFMNHNVFCVEHNKTANFGEILLPGCFQFDFSNEMLAMNIEVYIEKKDSIWNYSQFEFDKSIMLLDINYGYFLQEIISSRLFIDSFFLSIVCRSGHVKIVKLLLDQPGINVNEPNRTGRTPLEYACDYGHVEIVNLLLSQPGINANMSNFIALGIACKSGNIEMVNLLLSRFINVNTSSDTTVVLSFRLAFEFGHVEIVKLLLNQFNVNASDAYGLTPLHIACESGHVEIVNLLLDQPGIDVNISSNNGVVPLHIACESGHVEIVKRLLFMYYINVNASEARGLTPLHIACDKGYVEIVKLLLGKPDINVNASDAGFTPLHIACNTGNDRIISELLMDGRADCSLKCMNNPSFSIYKGNNSDLKLKLFERAYK